MKRIISLFLAAFLALALPVTALAADTAQGTTLRLAAFEGTVTVTNAGGKSVTPKEDMRLYNGYTVATGAKSEAYVSLDGSKAVKLGASGKLEVKKSGKQLEVSLISGELFFNVTAPLKADESLNIRTSTMVTGVRGSYGWVNTTEMGLMHGHVRLVCVNPVTGETRTAEVYSGERVYYGPEADASADPALKQIDFIREEITNPDVPAIVVGEMLRDETLTGPVEADVPAVDVPALLEGYEALLAAEEAETAARQAAGDAALAAQEAALAKDGGASYYFKNPSGSGGGGSSYTPPTPASFTVTFDGNGADGGATAAQTFTEGAAQNLTANGFTYTGYTFSGWNTAADGTGTAYADGASYTAAADITLYAQWTADSYTVTFNANGGTGGTATQSFTYGAAQNLTANSFIRTGYTFSGWNTAADGTGTDYDDGASYTATADITLYAVWWNHPTDYDGLKTALDSSDSDIYVDSDITHDDATAAGTLTVSGDKTLHTDKTVTTSDELVLSAGSTLTITGGGTLQAAGVTVNCKLTVAKDAALTVNGALNLNDADSVLTVESGGTVTVSGVTTKRGTITNGGTMTTSNSTENYGTFTNSGTYTIGYTLTNRSSFTNTGVIENSAGAIINGVYDSTDVHGTFTNSGEIRMSKATSGNIQNLDGNTFSNNAGGTITGFGTLNNYAMFYNYGTVSVKSYEDGGTGTVTGTAISIAATYTVTFMPNGGAFGANYSLFSNQTVGEGQTAAEPAETPNGDGSHTFAGWYTDSACTDGNAFDFSTPITENITLYAKWTAS